MNNKIIPLFIAGIIFLSGIIFGYLLRSGDLKPLDLNPFEKNCFYENKIYRSGEGFKAADGCNSCSCQDGRVSCTLMACTP